MRDAAFATIVLAALGFGSSLSYSADLAGSAGDASYTDPSAWSGFYLGVHTGYGFGETKHSRSLCEYTCDVGVLDDDFIDVQSDEIDDFEAGGTFEGDLKGYLGGAHFGGNLTQNGFLVGAEASFSLSALAATINTDQQDWDMSNGSTFDASMKDELSNLGLAEAKLGVANEAYVVYLRGGLALGELRSTLDLVGYAGDDFTLSSETSSLRAGWTVGGGLDIMVADKTSIGIAYNYVDYGNVLSSDIAEVVNSEQDDGVQGVVERDISAEMHLVRASLNYHF